MISKLQRRGSLRSARRGATWPYPTEEPNPYQVDAYEVDAHDTHVYELSA
jgi:hypothetical protein